MWEETNMKHLYILRPQRQDRRVTDRLGLPPLFRRAPGWGAVALGILVLSCGCGDSPEVGIRKAVEQVPLKKLEYPPFGMVRDQVEEGPTRQRLAVYEPQEAAPIIARIYQESEDPTTKAKALAAAKLLLPAWPSRVSDGTPVAVRQRVLELARAGLESDNIRVAFHALRLLLHASDGGPEDVRRVAQKLEATEHPTFFSLAYVALGRWRARDPILEQVFRPSPPKTDEDAYLVWAIRTEAAVCAWSCTVRRGEDIPSHVRERLLELMRTRPQMARTVAHIFVKMEAKSLVPEIKSKVYEPEGPLATKVFTSAAILILAPQERQLRQEFPLLLKEYFRTRGHADEQRLNLNLLIVWLSNLTCEAGDTHLFDALWEAFGQADDTERADFLADVLLVGQEDEPLVLHALSEIPDEELSRLMAGDRGLRVIVRGGLLREDAAMALPTQGAPSRAETEQRVRVLFDRLEKQGESTEH